MIGYIAAVVVVNLVAVVAVACKFCAHMTLATDRLHQRCQGCQMCQVSYVNKFRVHHTRSLLPCTCSISQLESLTIWDQSRLMTLAGAVDFVGAH